MNPSHPLYIPSKGRADTCYTMKALRKMGVPFYVVVEEQEFDSYARALGDKDCLLVLDPAYQRNYETLDPDGDSVNKSRGPGPARNFAWDHSISLGHDWHWVMDDNITFFARLNKNRRIPVGDGTCFRVMEDFCKRYENIAMAGPQYFMFADAKKKWPPFVMNTRIYSCNLIQNRCPQRWRGRYNEDTILSLDMLKAGWCTVYFNAFLQNKLCTQTVKGGNHDEFYSWEGTYHKSRVLVETHPDVSRYAYRFGRVHHFVNYRPFRGNRLVRRKDVKVESGINEYGMRYDDRREQMLND